MKKTPFPQANNIELIFNVLKDIDKDGISKENVSQKYLIDPRQGSYYLDSLLFLGFVEKINTRYFLTNYGVQVRLASQDNMINVFVDYILHHPFIGRLYEECKTIDEKDMKKYIANCIFNEYGISSNTAERRASSIKSWFDWINKNQ